MNDQGLVFRDFKKSDVDEVYTLLNSLSKESKKFFHPHPFDKKSLEGNCNSNSDHYYVMTYKNKIIGYSFLRLFGYEIPSYGGCIHEKYQGQGFGKKLTDYTVEKAKELGYKKIILKVYKNNSAAFNVYKKVGFEIIDDLKETDEWKMEIKLK